MSKELGEGAMHLKGLEKLREKLPDYPGNRIAMLPLRGLLATVVGYLFLIVLDSLPRLFNGIEILVFLEPFIPLLGSLFLACLAFWLIGRLWSQRDSMKEKYGDRAYQRMIMKGVTGVFLIPPLVFHAATSIRSLNLTIPPIPPVNELSILWSQSILPMLGVPSEVDIVIRVLLSGFFLLLGGLTVRAALFTFGIDYMTVVYLYYPEESEIQNHEIYSIVRHPAYMGGVLLTVAAIVFRFSIYSMILGFIAYLVFKLQTFREEKELIERFGDSFREYMSRTTALYVKPKEIPTYIRFLKGSHGQ